jgi:hypothetical protein
MATTRKAKLSLLTFMAAALVLMAGGIASAATPPPAATTPSVITGAVTEKTITSAVLHGTVNPNSAATSYVFEWGPTSAYGTASPSRSAGHGAKNVSVHTKIEGLIPGTLYHYRLSAANSVGGTSGIDRTFRTRGHPPPGAATGSASQVGLRKATLTGTVSPNGADTAYSFQYGLSETYGLQTASVLVPAGTAPVPVATQLSGLAPGTVFHYRIVASHGPFVSYGADATLVTLPLRQQRARVRAKTSPRHSRRRPHLFTTTGGVRGASQLPPTVRCQGSVAVSFFSHKRRLARKLVPLGPNCGFRARAKIRHLPKRLRRHHRLRLRVAVRFRGNGYLAPARAHPQHVFMVKKKRKKRHHGKH